MMRKLLALLMGGVVLIGPLSSIGYASDIPDEQWSIMTNLFDKSADKTGITLQGLSIQDNTDLSEKVSTLVGRAPGIDGNLGFRICKSIDDPFCAPGLAQYLTAFLPVCQSKSEINCIIGVAAIKNGSEIEGVYSRNFPEVGYTDFPGDPARGIPTGSTPSLWKFPNLIHGGGGDDYLASFFVRANFNGSAIPRINSYEATINPVSIEAGAWARNEAKDGTGKSLPSCTNHCGMELAGHSQNDKFICASLADGFCALRQAFPEGVRFKIKARLSQAPVGWLHGRLKSPDIQILDYSSWVEISVEAEPVIVPVVGILQDYYKLPAELQSKYPTPTGFQWGNGANSGIRMNSLLMPPPDSQQAFEDISIWKDYINDRANASPTEWAVRSLDSGVTTARCFQSTSDLVGIVTTNSMVYLGSPPTFNKENQTLEYKVASPHFTSKGEVFKGTYDLQIKSSVARCLYGFSSAPISAAISIVSENGEANIATTVVTEQNGWLKMAAYGFTFSNPTLLVKLSQASPTVSPTPTSTPTSTKKLTVKCAKGKQIRKISGSAPRCPSGFRKAA